jgi:hypothetical protein
MSRPGERTSSAASASLGVVFMTPMKRIPRRSYSPLRRSFLAGSGFSESDQSGRDTPSGRRPLDNPSEKTSLTRIGTDKFSYSQNASGHAWDDYSHRVLSTQSCAKANMVQTMRYPLRHHRVAQSRRIHEAACRAPSIHRRDAPSVRQRRPEGTTDSAITFPIQLRSNSLPAHA